MIVVMIVAVCMAMIVRMCVVMIRIQTTRASAKIVTQITSINRRTGGVGALAFDMVMMAFLRHALFGLKPQNLFAVFAHSAVHIVGTFQNFTNTFCEGCYNFGMVV